MEPINIIDPTAKLGCCFTGHRDLPADRLDDIIRATRARIVECYEERGIVDFYAGGALGFDTIAAETVISLRDDEGLPIKLHLLLPCPEQSKRWSEADKHRYGETIRRSNTTRFTSDHYTRFCMHVRNRALVDSSLFCIAYLEKASGGTAYTVDYAKKRGVEVANIASDILK